MEITGNLGNVMKESAYLAYTFAKAYMAKNFPDNDFLQRATIHLHVPEVRFLTLHTDRVVDGGSLLAPL